jgi:hypothetical protein
MADRARAAENAGMPVWSGVAGAAVMLALLAVALRATFGTSRDLHVPDPTDPTVHGLLVEVGRARTEVAATALRDRLADVGIRATVAPHPDGNYHLLVFPQDEVAARALLS